MIGKKKALLMMGGSALCECGEFWNGYTDTNLNSSSVTTGFYSIEEFGGALLATYTRPDFAGGIARSINGGSSFSNQYTSSFGTLIHLRRSNFHIFTWAGSDVNLVYSSDGISWSSYAMPYVIQDIGISADGNTVMVSTWQSNMLRVYRFTTNPASQTLVYSRSESGYAQWGMGHLNGIWYCINGASGSVTAYSSDNGDNWSTHTLAAQIIGSSSINSYMSVDHTYYAVAGGLPPNAYVYKITDPNQSLGSSANPQIYLGSDNSLANHRKPLKKSIMFFTGGSTSSIEVKRMKLSSGAIETVATLTNPGGSGNHRFLGAGEGRVFTTYSDSSNNIYINSAPCDCD